MISVDLISVHFTILAIGVDGASGVYNKDPCVRIIESMIGKEEL